ncbi:MAG: hypothetical protein WD471_00955 [Candidatus Paceibacterota bacterium]
MYVNKKFYIIPGWRDTCKEKQYQLLANSVRKKGYEVICKDIDWNKKLSDQFFPIEKNSVIFGFSIGAILARLIVQKYKCKLVILASMTPLVHFRGGEPEKLLIDTIGKELVDDVKENLKSDIKASRKMVMYGDKEDESGDIIVPDTDHEITSNYIKEVVKII